MHKGVMAFAVLAVLILPVASAPAGGLTVDVETGVVLSGYNDVRIPGDTGTKLSLSRELDIDPKVFVRGRVSYTIGGRHSISALVAPLRLEAEGSVDRDVVFGDETFAANAPLSAVYRFDSYRLTYRYDLLIRERLEIGVGLTAKIRDAAVSLESGSTFAEKTNTGFVPLINFRVRWRPWDAFGFLLEGDALAAPQGRAEDVFGGVVWDASRSVTLRAGYRILEGGADNDEVYSFALLNYLAAGATVSF